MIETEFFKSEYDLAKVVKIILKGENKKKELLILFTSFTYNTEKNKIYLKQMSTQKKRSQCLIEVTKVMKFCLMTLYLYNVLNNRNIYKLKCLQISVKTKSSCETIHINTFTIYLTPSENQDSI